jgi:hypothetical protein
VLKGFHVLLLTVWKPRTSRAVTVVSVVSKGLFRARMSLHIVCQEWERVELSTSADAASRSGGSFKEACLR